jgi:hypothetical protein
MKWWVNGVGQLSLGCVGFVVNSISISILIREEMASTFNLLLACLAFSDNAHYICSVAMAFIIVSSTGKTLK